MNRRFQLILTSRLGNTEVYGTYEDLDDVVREMNILNQTEYPKMEVRIVRK